MYIAKENIKIVVEDNLVVIDQMAVKVDCSALKFWALVFDVNKSAGFIEYRDRKPMQLNSEELYHHAETILVGAVLEVAGNLISEIKTKEKIQADLEKTLEFKIKRKITDITIAAQYFIDQNVNEHYPAFEQLTFSIQRAEAVAFNLDDKAPTPFIDNIALNKNVSRAHQIARVIEKSAEFEFLCSSICGQRQRLVLSAEAALQDSDLGFDLVFTVPD